MKNQLRKLFAMARGSRGSTFLDHIHSATDWCSHVPCLLEFFS